MAIEECGELIVILSHHLRGRPTPDLLYEIADVEIMIGQLKEMFDKHGLLNARHDKLRRLRDRVEMAEARQEAEHTSRKEFERDMQRYIFEMTDKELQA
jgi:hypothetical protein